MNFLELSRYDQHFRYLDMCIPKKKVLSKKIQLINVKDDFQSVTGGKMRGNASKHIMSGSEGKTNWLTLC